VNLDAEGWDRLITWIDLNTPAHGTWTEIVGANKVVGQRDRRREMLKRYAQRDEDPEAIAAPAPAIPFKSPTPPTAQPQSGGVEIPGWPFDAAEAGRRQAAGGPIQRRMDLGEGVFLELQRIPAGEFPMVKPDGAGSPVREVVANAYWLGRCEITNEQFARFDPNHDSRIERGDFLQFSTAERGYPANGPKQPVVRVSWDQANAFCRWLAERTGEPCSLPSEAQWEYACRAGTATPLWYGGLEMDFGKSANLADKSLRILPTLGWGLPSGAIPPWRPAIESVNDQFRIAAPVGSFAANAWGLCDMAGNVWEWTTGDFNPERKAVRGGSWSDRPAQATSESRQGYRPWQRVYHVGFRVMVAEGITAPVTKAP
jgi:formylglycine-generating enzyme required for sulfatase activity